MLDAKSFKDASQPGSRLKLIQLRNPWGSHEWTGAWSDGSKEWESHWKARMRASIVPTVRACDARVLVCARICHIWQVRKILRPTDADDGSFWMEFGDFASIFTSIDVCSRSTGLRDLNLDAKEADGCLLNGLGPCVGCCTGCAYYWCCCKGCGALYCDVKASTTTVHVDDKGGRDDDLFELAGAMMARD